jgi:hypothetical protein
MNNEHDEGISEKITDLTESLYRTTDVLSSADRMIDHYRDLNREQEHEIARVCTVYILVLLAFYQLIRSFQLGNDSS